MCRSIHTCSEKVKLLKNQIDPLENTENLLNEFSELQKVSVDGEDDSMKRDGDGEKRGGDKVDEIVPTSRVTRSKSLGIKKR